MIKTHHLLLMQHINRKCCFFLFSGQCTNVKWSSVSYITVNYEKRPLMIGTYRLSHEATYQLAHSISALQIMTKA